jgi:hypothetical protein
MFLMGPTDFAASALNDIRFALINVGIRVNMQKSAALCKPDRIELPASMDVRKSIEGLVIFGSPIGSKDFVQLSSIETIDRYQHSSSYEPVPTQDRLPIGAGMYQSSAYSCLQDHDPVG